MTEYEVTVRLTAEQDATLRGMAEDCDLPPERMLAYLAMHEVSRWMVAGAQQPGAQDAQQAVVRNPTTEGARVSVDADLSYRRKCPECRHVAWSSRGVWVCRNRRVSNVTCIGARAPYGDCGSEGRYWEAKE